MIILRKLGKPDPCRVIISDSLTGTADGSNQKFYVSYEYAPDHIEIIYNGQVLTSPSDFTETGLKEITFVYLKPTDITALTANYETGDCDGIVPTFLRLEDTPANYVSQANKIVVVKADETGLTFIDQAEGLTNFIELTDTPTTYSGFENHYVKVNQDGSALNFVLPEGEVQEGIENIPNGVSSTAVSFDHRFDSDLYVLTVSMENKVDSEPSVYPTLIKDKTDTGFTVDFSGDTDSSNYYLNWRATLSGTGTVGGSGAGIYELSDDLSPELGGDLDVGDNLIILDTSPNGQSIHGYDVGASGDASEMYVSDNPTGYACPLYMKSDGTWATCCAASGTHHMPCAAMALEEDDGAIKKILWKGNIRKGGWSWTPGQTMFVSTIKGAITNVEPNGGSWVQPIGIAISSDTIRFDPGFYPGYIKS